MKRKYLPLIIKRDGIFECFYCKKSLHQNSYVYEHLNDNRLDNRIDNIVFGCQSCNNKKPFNEEMQLRAKLKLEQNELSNFMRERNLEDEINSREASTEIVINVSNFDLTKQYITDIVDCDGCAAFTDALNSCVALCKEKTGHGSHQSIRNYISALTSTLGDFEIVRGENGRKEIIRRAAR